MLAANVPTEREVADTKHPSTAGNLFGDNFFLKFFLYVFVHLIAGATTMGGGLLT